MLFDIKITGIQAVEDSPPKSLHRGGLSKTAKCQGAPDPWGGGPGGGPRGCKLARLRMG